MAWLQLIRWKNLLIILATQFVAWFCVILPCNPFCLSVLNFSLLSLSTICLAAAGYIINDYFDIRIDAINRPEKMVLGKTIPRRTAIIVHSVLNFVGILMAYLVAKSDGRSILVLIQVFCSLLLWLYSSRYKRAYVTGNLVVSFLTALTIIELVIYEPRMLQIATLPVFYGQINQSALPFWMLIGYSWFAFILNWMREIVKDMEDFTGDAKEGCKTMPIVKGLAFSTRFIITLAAFAIVPLFISVYVLWVRHHPWFSGYLFVFLVVPTMLWCVFLQKRYDTIHFQKASRLLKLIMIPGIFSLVVYYLHL